MKCSNCGSELADGTKFCGECGTKVVLVNKCPECGAVCAQGAKFCGECGHKMSSMPAAKSAGADDENEETPLMTVKDFFGESEDEEASTKSADSCQIDWFGKATIDEVSMPLDDGQVDAINVDLKALREKANDGRVLLRGDDGFREKFKAFKSVYEERIGVNCDEFPLFQDSCLIGMVDNSKAGTGKRGTLFTRMGIIVIDGDYPAAIENDEPLDGIVPWKLFFIFSEPADEFYRLMRPVTASTSNKVDEEIRERYKADIKKPNGRNNLLFRYSNVGVSKEEVAEFMENLQDSIADCDYADDDED